MWSEVKSGVIHEVLCGEKCYVECCGVKCDVECSVMWSGVICGVKCYLQKIVMCTVKTYVGQHVMQS